METETNAAHSYSEGDGADLQAPGMTSESGSYKFEKPEGQSLDLDSQYQRLEEAYKTHKAKAREHTAQASEIHDKMKKLSAERKRQERRLKDILE